MIQLLEELLTYTTKSDYYESLQNYGLNYRSQFSPQAFLGIFFHIHNVIIPLVEESTYSETVITQPNEFSELITDHLRNRISTAFDLSLLASKVSLHKREKLQLNDKYSIYTHFSDLGPIISNALLYKQVKERLTFKHSLDHLRSKNLIFSTIPSTEEYKRIEKNHNESLLTIDYFISRLEILTNYLEENDFVIIPETLEPKLYNISLGYSQPYSIRSTILNDIDAFISNRIPLVNDKGTFNFEIVHNDICQSRKSPSQQPLVQRLNNNLIIHECSAFLQPGNTFIHSNHTLRIGNITYLHDEHKFSTNYAYSVDVIDITKHFTAKNTELFSEFKESSTQIMLLHDMDCSLQKLESKRSLEMTTTSQLPLDDASEPWHTLFTIVTQVITDYEYLRYLDSYQALQILSSKLDHYLKFYEIGQASNISDNLVKDTNELELCANPQPND